MRKLFIICIGALMGFQNYAQEDISLTLEQAIAYGLQNSYSVINANRDIDAAKKKKWETVR